MSRLQITLSDIDALHARDPQQTNGKANELIYAERMTRWLKQLAPNASEELQIAVRSQHLSRWELPRTNYPTGRTGYLKWRSELGKMHAEKAASIMATNGYNEESQKQTYSLVRKLNLKRDHEAQTLEDCACMVFLEFELSAFVKKHSEDKLIRIIQKTWAKMSSQAQQAALELPFSSEETLLEKSLNSETESA